MNLKKLVVTGVTMLVGCAALTFADGSTKSVSADNVLNWSEDSELQTLDPATSVDTTSGLMLRNSYEGLYRLGKDGQVKKGLVKTEKVSDDGLTYTFTLQKNAKWSNGDPVTAKDFVYGWQRAVDPKTGASNSNLFEGIKNAADIVAGKMDPKELGVKATDDHTLVVTLDKKIPYFKSLVATQIFSPQNQKVVEKYGKKYGTEAKYSVSNGPFKVTGWNGSNQKWSLVKNNNYWDKKAVKLDKVNFQVAKTTSTSYSMYQQGDLDETMLSTEQARQLKGKNDFVARKQARVDYLEVNKTSKAFANENIRKAISYALNRDQLANKVLGDGTTPTKSFVSKGLMEYKGKDFNQASATDQGTTYNKKLAQEYWQKGLKELGVKSLTFTVLGDDDDLAKKVNEYIQSQLQTNLKGAHVKVQNINKKSRIDRMKQGKFDLVQTGWTADYQDATSFLNLFTKDSAYNFGKYNSEEYDKLMQDAKSQDGDVRWNTLVKANKLLLEDQAVVPLYQPVTATMQNPDVKGLVYNTISEYNFKEAYLN